jgi:hypothetical protein
MCARPDARTRRPAENRCARGASIKARARGREPRRRRSRTQRSAEQVARRRNARRDELLATRALRAEAGTACCERPATVPRVGRGRSATVETGKDGALQLIARLRKLLARWTERGRLHRRAALAELMTDGPRVPLTGVHQGGAAGARSARPASAFAARPAAARPRTARASSARATAIRFGAGIARRSVRNAAASASSARTRRPAHGAAPRSSGRAFTARRRRRPTVRRSAIRGCVAGRAIFSIEVHVLVVATSYGKGQK